MRRRPAERLLANPDGERVLTDLRHVGQVLHATALERHLGPTALTEWLRHRIGEAGRDTAAERSRRLESDAEAVQIVTVHRSQGTRVPGRVPAVRVGPQRAATRRTRCCSTTTSGRPRARRRRRRRGPDGRPEPRGTEAEEAGEDLRLLYVALTRARSQVVTWWAPTTTTDGVVAAPDAGRPTRSRATTRRPSVKVPGDAVVLAAAAVSAAPAGGRGGDAARPGSGSRRPRCRRGAGRGRRFTRDAGHGVAADVLHGADRGRARRREPSARRRPRVQADEEPEAAGGGRAQRTGDGGRPRRAGHRSGPAAGRVHGRRDLDAVPSPMADLPMGAGFGTLVHAVLETVETADLGGTDADLRSELAGARSPSRAGPPARRRRTGRSWPTRWCRCCAPRSARSRTAGALADVAPATGSSELEFELPLAGGDTPAGELDAGRGRGAAAPRTSTPDDPLPATRTRLGAPGLAGQPLRGYLTGSIDSVLRVDGRGSSSSTTRRTGSGRRSARRAGAADGGALHGPSACARRWSTRTTRCRRCSTPSRCTATCAGGFPGTTPETHLGGVAIPVPARDVRARTRRCPDGGPCGVFGVATACCAGRRAVRPARPGSRRDGRGR